MLLIIRRIPGTPVKKKSTPGLTTAARIFGVPAALRLPVSPAIISNERGVALVMALILGLIGMLMIASLLYIGGTGIWTSGSKTRYQTALQASHGGMNFFTKEIIQRGLAGEALNTMGDYGGIFTTHISSADFTRKLTITGDVNDGVYPADNPDATLALIFTAPTPTINVTTTILSTTIGNSGTSVDYLWGGGVHGLGSGTVTPLHIPFLFQTDVRGQRAVNPRERARLSGVYAY